MPEIGWFPEQGFDVQVESQGLEGREAMGSRQVLHEKHSVND